MWHVSSRSGVATLRTAIHLLLTYLLTYLLFIYLSVYLSIYLFTYLLVIIICPLIYLLIYSLINLSVIVISGRRTVPSGVSKSIFARPRSKTDDNINAVYTGIYLDFTSETATNRGSTSDRRRYNP